MAVAEFPVLLSAGTDAGLVPARAVRPVRFYFLLLFVLGLAAFVFGVQGRFPAGLFLYPPPVDWLPPLSGAQWQAAFAAHQQDPIFAACGGAQSLKEFQTLYWWEWLRQASLLLLATGATAGFIGAAAMRQFRFALPRLVGLGILVLAYAVMRWLVGLAASNVDEIARFNVGQYRHAVDVTFASAVVAAVLTSALGPPRRLHPAAWLWGGALLLDIAFGALFMARDAAAVWPGLGDVPPLERFVSYDPFWLNFLFNPYTIQLVHRALSGGPVGRVRALSDLVDHTESRRRRRRHCLVRTDDRPNGARHLDPGLGDCAPAVDPAPRRRRLAARGRVRAAAQRAPLALAASIACHTANGVAGIVMLRTP
jgi:hypothetical protein